MAWNESDPVSTPPGPVVGVVAFLIVLAAVGGVGLGFKASWRDATRPQQGSVDTQAAGQAILAQPIVELPQPQAAPAPEAANTLASATNTTSKNDGDNNDDSSNDIAVRRPPRPRRCSRSRRRT